MRKKIVLVSISVVLLIVVVTAAWCLLHSTDKSFEFPEQDEFSLDVKYNAEDIREGQEIVFEAELTNLSGKEYQIWRPTEIITYAIDGEWEALLDITAYDTFEKKKSYEREIHITPETGGSCEVMIIAHFRIDSPQDNEFRDYTISKTILLDVQPEKQGTGTD